MCCSFCEKHQAEVERLIAGPDGVYICNECIELSREILAEELEERDPNALSLRPQPMIAVADVQSSSRWYQTALGAERGHGGSEYEQLLVDGNLVLQLHQLETEHHHGTIGDPGQPLGNGVAVWFEVDDFDAAVTRIHELEAELVADVHVNPNAGNQEIWIRDPDGYLVVFAEPSQ